MVSNRRSQSPEWTEAVAEALEHLVKMTPELRASGNDLVDIACRINSNAFGITDYRGATSTQGIPQTIAVGTFPLSALFNHACSPSIVVRTELKVIDGVLKPVMLTQAVRDIPEGDQVFNSYIDLMQPTVERRLALNATKHFWCICDRCQSFENGQPQDGCLDGFIDLNGNIVSVPTSIKDEFERDYASVQDFLTVGNDYFAHQSLNTFLTKYLNSQEPIRPHPRHAHLHQAMFQLLTTTQKLAGSDHVLVQRCLASTPWTIDALARRLHDNLVLAVEEGWYPPFCLESAYLDSLLNKSTQ
jgi:hypothetical protein